MEYIEGGNLQDFIDFHGGRLSEEYAMFFFNQIIKILKFFKE